MVFLGVLKFLMSEVPLYVIAKLGGHCPAGAQFYVKDFTRIGVHTFPPPVSDMFSVPKRRGSDSSSFCLITLKPEVE